ncbi:MAG: iron-containing alcohol dehydrogenase [Desulfobacterales bacterium]|jgi:alcohol dehydrogenase class IV
MMERLRKFIAPEIVFGLGALDLAGRYARNLGANNVFLVSDPGVEGAGWTDAVIRSIQAASLKFALFTEISPNPRAEEVMQGADEYARQACDVIVVVGGGSAMDCAKAIGIVHTNGRHVLEFEGVDRVDVPGPPIICIPTTAGTSADLSQFVIISNHFEKRKIAIISKSVVPDVALVDPQPTTTMDAYLTACTGMDAMVHALEALVSNAGSEMTDMHAREAIQRLFTYLPQAIDRPGDLAIRRQVMFGSLSAGLAFSNASLGAVHAMAHSIGGRFDLPHGECNSLLIEHVMHFNWPAAGDRYRELGTIFGLELNGLSSREACQRITGAVKQFKQHIGITRSLKSCGIQQKDIAPLARMAVKDPCMATNPLPPTIGDIESVYDQAL